LLLAALSEGYLAGGRTEEARELGRRALDLAQTNEERGHEAWILRLLGQIASRHVPADIATAQKYCRQALALAGDLGMAPLVAHCHLDLGRLHTRLGECADAREHVATSVRLFGDLDMRSWLEQATAAEKEVR
jgi:tetratricopeptide (TPR) repeat protein